MAGICVAEKEEESLMNAPGAASKERWRIYGKSEADS